MMSSQCSFLVIPVLDYLDPGKRMVSSQCLTLGSSKLCLQISLIRVAFYAKTQLELHAK
ncbi:MAG: hypothetical protein ACEY3M_19060 [Wolbachia sp.]